MYKLMYLEMTEAIYVAYNCFFQQSFHYIDPLEAIEMCVSSLIQ